jgi:hypothetical protein
MHNRCIAFAHDFAWALLGTSGVPLGIILAWLMISPAGAAQAVCAPWDEVKEFLSEQHHETEVGGGFINPSAVMVLLMSPGGETWTIAALGTDGQACITSSGSDWFQRSIPAREESPS